jgi:hypothetical protein
MTFLRGHQVIALISYHSAALGVFPGGSPPTERSIQLAREIAQISHYAYPPVETGCAITGGLVDWAAEQGTAAVDIELHNHIDTDLEENINIFRLLLGWQPDPQIPDQDNE